MLELDSEQQAAVDYEGSTAVIAGPGSGKTRTLVAKAEKLFSQGASLACLTFTRAAAAEMRVRMPGIEASTIHSYCHNAMGWTGNYESLLVKYLEGAYGDKYDWLLVDEVQDLNEQEWAVVMSLKGKYIFAVGDPKQSIYGFNEAMGLKAFHSLRELDCKTFQLRNNYRSCPDVVRILETIYKRGLVSTSVKETGLTAVLARTNDQVREISDCFKAAGIGFTVRRGGSERAARKEENHGSDKLKVMTCHCSKGLEFDKVVLYNWEPHNLFYSRYSEGDEEMNLFYVAAARASKEFRQAWSLEKLKQEVGNGT